jgi:hypothetical protein
MRIYAVGGRIFKKPGWPETVPFVGRASDSRCNVTVKEEF